MAPITTKARLHPSRHLEARRTRQSQSWDGRRKRWPSQRPAPVSTPTTKGRTSSTPSETEEDQLYHLRGGGRRLDPEPEDGHRGPDREEPPPWPKPAPRHTPAPEPTPTTKGRPAPREVRQKKASYITEKTAAAA
ncbi:hypothetical protein DL769_000626 [Monosporascus sp. CRB-8-3]|nr:hypothetical protein DL769_000626 [Monosporascus sp. CRB-8-3]